MAAILDFTQDLKDVKRGRKLKFSNVRHEKYDVIKHVAAVVLFSQKRYENMHFYSIKARACYL